MFRSVVAPVSAAAIKRVRSLEVVSASSELLGNDDKKQEKKEKGAPRGGEVAAPLEPQGKDVKRKEKEKEKARKKDSGESKAKKKRQGSVSEAGDLSSVSDEDGMVGEEAGKEQGKETKKKEKEKETAKKKDIGDQMFRRKRKESVSEPGDASNNSESENSNADIGGNNKGKETKKEKEKEKEKGKKRESGEHKQKDKRKGSVSEPGEVSHSDADSMVGEEMIPATTEHGKETKKKDKEKGKKKESSSHHSKTKSKRKASMSESGDVTNSDADSVTSGLGGSANTLSDPPTQAPPASTTPPPAQPAPRLSLVDVVRSTVLHVVPPAHPPPPVSAAAPAPAPAPLRRKSASADSLVLFGEHEAVQTEPIYFGTPHVQQAGLSWTTRLWRSISETYHAQHKEQTPHPKAESNAPPPQEQQQEAMDMRPLASAPRTTAPSLPNAESGAAPEAKPGVYFDLGWIFQRVDTVKPRERSPPLQRMRKEDMIMLQQEQQCISPEQTETARAMLKIYLACAEHLYGIPVEDLQPLYQLATNPHISAERLQLVLADVLRANPWLIKSGELYCNWWCAAATTSFKNNFKYLLQDMMTHPRPEDEVEGVLFVRPASALGHMRRFSSDSTSLASVKGLSINVVELPQNMQESELMDALAQLSMVESIDGMTALQSPASEIDLSSIAGGANDVLLDTLSLQTYGTAATSLPVQAPGGSKTGSSVVDAGEVFVLLDRLGNYMATIRVADVATPAPWTPRPSAGQPAAVTVASGPIHVAHGLAIPQEGSYVRRDIAVELQCDVNFLRGDHVPPVLQGACFKGATVVGTAIVVQRQDVVLALSDTVVQTHCVAMTELLVNVDESTRLGSYVCVSVHNLPVARTVARAASPNVLATARTTPVTDRRSMTNLLAADVPGCPSSPPPEHVRECIDPSTDAQRNAGGPHSSEQQATHDFQPSPTTPGAAEGARSMELPVDSKWFD